MENFTYEGDNQRKIESFLMVIYTIYCSTIVLLSFEWEWESWIGIFLVAGLACCWMMYVSRFKSYAFRAKITSVLMQGTAILYATHRENLVDVLPVFMVFVVCMGLYGIADVITLSFFSALFIFFYHGVIIETIAWRDIKELSIIVSQLANIFLFQYVVYTWTKRNREGSEKLLDVINELKRVENSKDDFLANVSHEIRTPINTICGMSEILLREELPYKIKENVLNIQQAGRNLVSVVGDILDFSELNSGKMELEEEAYNITSTINDIINMTMARKNEKKIELIVDCDATMPCALLGDEKKLRRVILNIVDNAIKFTDEGCVSLSIGYRRESYGINLIVKVKDTGIGIDEESLEKLFVHFNQVDARRNRQESGIGLGLAISQALVHKMGGAIILRSKAGKGTTVKFTIPQKVLDEQPIAALQEREHINVAAYIDMEQFDMMEIRDEYSNMIIHMVEQLRGKCHVCRNFAELQRRASKEPFSHIFTSTPEYLRDKEYFDELAQKTNVVVVMERHDEKYVTNPRLLKVYKPFYILSIVSALNSSKDAKENKALVAAGKFETKDVHVLVVDDNRMNLRVIEGLLTGYKIKVTMATSGQEALEKILSANYDFVFMDHMMPEMDGVETLQRIRHKVGSYYQKVPIIALTANAVAGTREMLISEGFTDFLEKPIERSVLERVLRRNLDADKIVTLESDMVEKKVTPSNETVEQTATKQDVLVNDAEEKLDIEGLDVKSGIVYCNGREQYIKVLQGYCEEADNPAALAEKLYNLHDWKNYTITVHGMKSAMRSIGALHISNLAKELEFAGKEGRIDYILEHHDELIKEYNELFACLRQNKLICPQGNNEMVEKDETEGTLLPLSEAEFERMIVDMEDAMYSLDGAKLMEIVTELQKYKFCGTSLKSLVDSVSRKIEMADYVSAVDTIVKMKDKLSGKER